jgi:hypothetical protein
MRPSFLLRGRVDRLLVCQLRALKDTMTLLVTFEANSLLVVSCTLLSSQSSSDGTDEIHSTNV